MRCSSLRAFGFRRGAGGEDRRCRDQQPGHHCTEGRIGERQQQKRAGEPADRRNDTEDDGVLPVGADLLGIGKRRRDIAWELDDGRGRVGDDRRQPAKRHRSESQEGAATGNGIDDAGQEAGDEEQKDLEQRHGFPPKHVNRDSRWRGRPQVRDTSGPSPSFPTGGRGWGGAFLRRACDKIRFRG